MNRTQARPIKRLSDAERVQLHAGGMCDKQGLSMGASLEVILPPHGTGLSEKKGRGKDGMTLSPKSVM